MDWFSWKKYIQFRSEKETGYNSLHTLRVAEEESSYPTTNFSTMDNFNKEQNTDNWPLKLFGSRRNN